MAFKKFTASETILKPDPRYNSKLVSKFINCLMWQGKKTVAQKIFYDAMDTVIKKMKDVPPLEVFETAINNVSEFITNASEFITVKDLGVSAALSAPGEREQQCWPIL